MNKKFWIDLRHAISSSGHVWYHIGLVSLSGGIAMSLPYLAQGFLTYWAFVQNEKVYLVSAEITVAIVLILFFNHFSRSLQSGKLAKVARGWSILSLAGGTWLIIK